MLEVTSYHVTEAQYQIWSQPNTGYIALLMKTEPASYTYTATKKQRNNMVCMFVAVCVWTVVMTEQ